MPEVEAVIDAGATAHLWPGGRKQGGRWVSDCGRRKFKTVDPSQAIPAIEPWHEVYSVLLPIRARSIYWRLLDRMIHRHRKFYFPCRGVLLTQV